MARAGYDPRALARMFETIERESKSSGGGGPQWMSSHPNPGNRTQYITKEARAADDREAAPTRASSSRSRRRSRRCRRPKSMADLARARSGRAAKRPQSVGTPGQPVPRPSSQYRTLNGGRCFQASVPIQLDQPGVEQRDQGRPAERLRSAQRPDGLQPRRRVRRREGRHRAICAKRPTPG